ncbi:MAG: 1,4-beta-xylanase [Flavobacteriaceae bacterium]
MKNNYKIVLLMVLLSGLVSCNLNEKNIQTQKSKRWSEERIWDWYGDQPWLVGTNFITSSCINQLEFWQEQTFDPELIDNELKLSASIGMNTHRVFLHDLLWQQDSIGLMDRMDKFLEISEKNGIKTVFVFFDDVWHPVPKLGIQPEPIPHVHNSGWVQSPGAKILYDSLNHHKLKPYVKGVVGRFANDSRILAWDLYNEPGQKGISSHNIPRERVIELYKKIGIEITDKNYSEYNLNQIDLKDIKQKHTLSLLKKTVKWVREVNPSQPITIGIYEWDIEWGVMKNLSELNQFIINSSDIVSFHSYASKNEVLRRVEELKNYNRPILCTEYIAREYNNTFKDILPIFEENKIGAYNWGLVSGKTNTIYPWKSWDSTYTGPPDKWHHDIFYQNGEPFSIEEIEFIKNRTSTINK